MCDVVAKLPQPKFKTLVEDVFDGGVEEGAVPVAQPVTAAPRAPAAKVTTKRRPDKGPQTGSLLDYEPD